jgi:tRNA pseudouridine38-40 synthase
VSSLVRYKLVIAYRGTRFHGWQIQTVSETWKSAHPEGGMLRTVQGVLSEAVSGVVGHPVTVVGSSRTDAGVHAKGQVGHFDTSAVQIPMEGLRRAVNARLPGDIVIREMERVGTEFDAISDAVHKRYQYVVWNAEERPIFMEDLAFHRWQELDVEAMRDAGGRFVGTRDFASFARPGHGRENTIRTVTGCEVSRRGKLLVIGVSGTGFLWNQVRIMAGTLIEVGIGRFRPEDVTLMLEAKDRRAAGQTAPAHGLYLQWIVHRNENGLEPQMNTDEHREDKNE